MRSFDLQNGPIPFLGQELPLEVKVSPLLLKQVLHLEGRLVARIPAVIPSGKRPPYVKEMITDWLKAQARNEIPKRTRLLATSLGLNINRITIKDTRSRWGSCSAKNNLSFNWRLIMAPAEIVDYLIVHETAHLEELNHSASFWNTVQRRCPNYRAHQTWLKACGRALLAA